MRKPLIGLTTRSIRGLSGVRLDRSQAVAEQYVEAIRWAGGLPVAVPSNLGAEGAKEVAAGLAGCVLTGGPDVDPALFGEEPKPGLRNVDPVRDEVELALCRRARERDAPLLAICRGIQVLNVAFAGAVVQHLREEDGWIWHEVSSFVDGPGHSVKVEEGTRLAAAMGAGTHRVNSHHHQGVSAAAKDLVASAHSPDGLIEALEHPGCRFLVGVGWHPELSYGRDPAQGALLRAFVEACGG